MAITFIISDLHLSAQRPELVSAFEDFIKILPSKSKLIIAGDFFDFFIGIRKNDPLTQRIKTCLLGLKTRNVDIGFMCGNRDFLVTKHDANFFGMRLLPEIYLLKTPLGRAMLIHGDMLCTNDKVFMRFKQLAHNTIARIIFRALPYRLRLIIGKKIRNSSSEQDASRAYSPIRYGAVKEVAEELLKKNGCNILIHGHFHVFEKKKDEYFKGSLRLGLGAWGKSLSFVKIDEEELILHEEPLISKRS